MTNMLLGSSLVLSASHHCQYVSPFLRSVLVFRAAMLISISHSYPHAVGIIILLCVIISKSFWHATVAKGARIVTDCFRLFPQSRLPSSTKLGEGLASTLLVPYPLPCQRFCPFALSRLRFDRFRLICQSVFGLAAASCSPEIVAQSSGPLSRVQ